MKKPALLKSRYYKKKTNATAAALGDLAILLIPVIQVAIQTAPEMNPSLQHWLQTGVACVLIIFKFALKTIKAKDNEESEDTVAEG